MNTVSEYMTSGMFLLKQQYEDDTELPQFFVVKPNQAYEVDIEKVVLALAELGPESLGLKLDNSGKFI